jgi:hypothetical protein
MRDEPSNPRNVLSTHDPRCVALAIGPAIAPVEEVGMALQRDNDLELTAAELGALTALAKEAHACAEALHEYASTIEEEVQRGAWIV